MWFESNQINGKNSSSVGSLLTAEDNMRLSDDCFFFLEILVWHEVVFPFVLSCFRRARGVPLSHQLIVGFGRLFHLRGGGTDCQSYWEIYGVILKPHYITNDGLERPLTYSWKTILIFDVALERFRFETVVGVCNPHRRGFQVIIVGMELTKYKLT